MTDNVAGALAYIPIIGIIFLLIDPYKSNRGIRFHAFQGLFLLVCVIVLNILTGIIVGVAWSFWFLYSLIRLAFAVIWIYCMYQAYTGKKVVLPIIGPLAEKQAEPAAGRARLDLDEAISTARAGAARAGRAIGHPPSPRGHPRLLRSPQD